MLCLLEDGLVHVAKVLLPLMHQPEDTRQDTPPKHIILTPGQPEAWPCSILSLLKAKQGHKRYHIWCLLYDQPDFDPRSSDCETDAETTKAVLYLSVPMCCYRCIMRAVRRKRR